MSDFQALELMADRDGDIAASNTFVRGQTTKRGDEITMGISKGMLQKIATGKYLLALYVVNADEFEATKKELTK